MWYWSGGGVHWWGWMIGFVVMVAFWALIVFAIFAFVRSVSSRDHFHAPPAHEEPERALARRFANGEIDEGEFHRRLDVLRSKGLAGKG